MFVVRRNVEKIYISVSAPSQTYCKIMLLLASTNAHVVGVWCVKALCGVPTPFDVDDGVWGSSITSDWKHMFLIHIEMYSTYW